MVTRAVVCLRAGDHSAAAQVFLEAGLRSPKQKAGFFPRRTDTNRLPLRESFGHSADVRIPHGEDSTLAVISCLCWATRNFGPLMASTQNLTGCDTPKRTFHNTAATCHDSARAPLAFPNDTAPLLTTHPTTSNFS